jgi:multiple sugar transport system ATP-binding protein
MGLADRIAVLHSGRIEQIDKPTELYRSPRSRFVGSFVGSPPMNFLNFPVQSGAVRIGAQTYPVPTAGGASVVLGIRAEDLEPADDGMAFSVRVTEPLGSHTLLTGDVDGQQARVIAESDARPAPGAVLRLRPRADRITWIDPQTGMALEAEHA